MLVFQLVASILFFAFCSYACIFADPDTSDVARLFMITIPSFLFKHVEKLLGQKKLSRLGKLLDRGLQIIYLVVVLGSWSIVFAYGYPEFRTSKHIHSYHLFAGYLVFAMCMGSWFYACQVGPGTITAQTIPLFDHYEYDNMLYTNRSCPTLKIRKVARSKYDRFTNKHVPRFDHFCGWLNQAVGEQNYRWFLLFLTVHVFMCIYGSWAIATLMYGIIVDKNLLNATFFNAITGTEVKADYFIVFHYLFMRYFGLCGVLLLMSVMTVMLGSFLGFHLYITSRNMTTNEFFKWKNVRKWHRKETQKYELALKQGKKGTKTIRNFTNNSFFPEQASDVDVGCAGPVEKADSLDVV